MSDYEVIYKCNQKLIEEVRRKKGGVESIMIADI